MSRQALFIHGTWLTPLIWSRFRRRFEACGYSCSAPAWPLLAADPAGQRSQPPRATASLGIAAILAHYAGQIGDLAQPPLLIGHDLGGLLVQLLLDRGLGCAGIAIAPPAHGGLEGLRGSGPCLLRQALWRGVLHMSPQHFARSMAQTLTPERQAAAYARHIVSAPGRVFFDNALGIGSRIDFGNPDRPPLLLIAAGADRSVRPAAVAAAYRRHRGSTAVTTFKHFSGYSHWLIAEPGWETIADYCIEWAQNQLGRF